MASEFFKDYYQSTLNNQESVYNVIGQLLPNVHVFCNVMLFYPFPTQHFNYIKVRM